MSKSGVAGRTAAARRLVQNIAKEHGYLGEEVYARMDWETRREVEEALLKKDEMIGASVITLAKNLYSKDIRWIFELLQNADDNYFSQALSSGAVPYVTFKMYGDRIIVECNEDGFTEANLRAICNVGKSSKTGAQGYIGEKGIGFKSVFKAAWKVHIQSGYYSFTFTHRRGDSGMGMISPEWYDEVAELPPSLTRMTLFLHDDDDAGGRRQNILSQLNELQPAMLLFLNKLKRIEVRIYDDAGNETSSSLLSLSDSGQINKPVLEKRKTEHGDTIRTEEKYHVSKSVARRLPPNENREYTPQEESSGAYSSAPVVLAFPLSDDDVPLIQPQEVFAFLPVRQAGFNFLIHSDFVTQANREDLVTTSSRNLSLLDSLAETFITAMRELSSHSTLKYQWMRYLPNLNHPWSPFWQKLVNKIKDRVLTEEIMILRDSQTQAQVRYTKRIDPIHDQYGNPLFDDLPGNSACYVSSAYNWQDLRLLEGYGLTVISQFQILDRVKADLSKDTSKMKSADTDADWHARAARRINFSFVKNWRGEIAQTKALELIPLVTGRWVSPDKVTIHFPVTSNGLLIPGNIGFHIVHPDATTIRERKELFLNLGVKYSSDNNVRTEILKKYQSSDTLRRMTVGESTTHLKFLYLTHNQSHSTSTYSNIWLCDNNWEFHAVTEDVFYFLDEDPYSLWKLVKEADEFPDWSHIHFLDEYYSEGDVGQAAQHNLTWREWLHTYLGVREYPRLLNDDRSSLSEECQFVAESVPSELLGFLNRSWGSEQSRMTDERIDDLKRLKVPCRGGRLVQISETYLPTASLVEKHDEFMRYGEFFPFLDAGDNVDQMSRWECLRALGVKSNPDLEFYLDILYYISRRPSVVTNMVDPSRVLHLYRRIYIECFDSDEEIRKRKQSQVWDFCESHDCVLAPSSEDGTYTWNPPRDCVRSGPTSLTTVVPVLPLYRAKFPDLNTAFPDFGKFLKETLGIKKCTWENIVSELEALKSQNSSDSDQIGALYLELKRMRMPRDALEVMKMTFGIKALIFADVGAGKWYTSDQCLCSLPTIIRGRVNLSTIYNEDIVDFFVEKLGVRKLDADIVYNELLELKIEDATVEQVKDLLWTLNSQLETQPLSAPAETLLQRRILPVRRIGGRVDLCSSAGAFGIVDLKELDQIFHDKVNVLDFTMNEVCRLKPFIKWAGLEDRYFSRLVEETTILCSDSKRPITDPTQNISEKAYGLLRIATHFKSPRVGEDGREFYELLRNLCVWETRGISTTFVMSIGGETVSESVYRGDIHIDDSDGLDIYLPHDEDLRDNVYLSSLPERLIKWIMTDPTTNTQRDIDSSAEGIVQGILQAKKTQVDFFLARKGVIEVDIPAQDEQEEAGNEPATPGLASTPTAVEPSTPRGLGSPQSDPVTPLFDSGTPYLLPETPATESSSYSTPSRSRARSRPGFTRDSPSPDSYFATYSESQQRAAAQEYRALLSQVVTMARRSHLLDGPMNLSELSDALGEGVTETRLFREYDLFGSIIAPMERDKKVGAAGELFVFELLSSMDPSLAGFTRANWTSTIRRYATEHPDYADMASWTGTETSDLEYNDANGTLTEALICKGHLMSRWRGSRPQYYIEVKSTPGTRDTPFFMSDAQYRKMKRLSTENSIYMIFRVFNLYSGRIAVDIYVDPAKLAEEGRLIFTADKWTVKPIYA